MNIFGFVIYGLITGTILFVIAGYIGSKINLGNKIIQLMSYIKVHKK